MANRREKVAQIIARAWTEPDFKARLLKYPEETLRANDIEVPDDLRIIMHEDTEEVEHGVLPAPPPGLTPDQLANPENVHFTFSFTFFHHKNIRPHPED